MSGDGCETGGVYSRCVRCIESGYLIRWCSVRAALRRGKGFTVLANVARQTRMRTERAVAFGRKDVGLGSEALAAGLMVCSSPREFGSSGL